MTLRPSLAGMAAAILVASLTAGCANYDYLQHTDRISYRAGNAVHANLERETINPSSDSMYDTSGLGKNGSVLPADSANSAGSQAPATPPTKPPTLTGP
jgi:hypothetical protein